MIFFCLFIVVDIAEVFLGGNDRDVCVASWQCAGPVVVEYRVTRCVPTTRGTLPPISTSNKAWMDTYHQNSPLVSSPAKANSANITA